MHFTSTLHVCGLHSLVCFEYACDIYMSAFGMKLEREEKHNKWEKKRHVSFRHQLRTRLARSLKTK